MLSLRNTQKDGILAWDCEREEHVLIFPTVLALLGDNPMQSEMACHIGLQGKAFCRACTVKRHDSAPAPEADQPQGSDSQLTAPTVPTTPTRPSQVDSGEDEATHTARDSDLSEAGSDVPRPGSKKKKAPETMAAMVTRVTSFLRVCQIFAAVPSMLIDMSDRRASYKSSNT
jgi:hypothetical protein